jgi:hypothetical protein
MTIKQITYHSHKIRTCPKCGSEFFQVFIRMFVEKEAAGGPGYGGIVGDKHIARIAGYQCANSDCKALFMNEKEHSLPYMGYERIDFWPPSEVAIDKYSDNKE